MHYRHEPYLTMIDCGPGRVVTWRKIRVETTKEIERVIEKVFMERGPVEEVLMDNDASFHSAVLRELCKEWGVKQYFRSTYCQSGNGIIERNHWTIKAVAERSRISPQEAVFGITWPQRMAKTKHPCHKSLYLCTSGNIHWPEWEEGNRGKRKSQWVRKCGRNHPTLAVQGKVTEVLSQNKVVVNGVPQHMLDIQRVSLPSDEEVTEVSQRRTHTKVATQAKTLSLDGGL